MNLLPKKNPTTVNIGENIAYIEKELASDTDLIRRSDAIKAVEDGMCTFYDCYVIEKLKEVPSVEPCKDAVSREWLLNELEEMNVANFYEANFHSNEMYGQMKRMLRDAPSVTVEPRQGEWIYHEDYHTCSVCGVDWVFTDGTDGSDIFPNSGARMFAKDTNVPNKEGADNEHDK